MLRANIEPCGPPRASLGMLPAEIKETIAGWVERLESEDQPAWYDDRPRQTKTGFALLPDQRNLPYLWAMTADVDPPEVPPSLKALSAVDLSFYHVCRSLIWKQLDLKCASIRRMEELIRDILPHQGKFVQSISWRELGKEMKAWESTRWPYTPSSPGDVRHDILLRILEACPNLDQLNIDQDSKFLGLPYQDPWGLYIEPVINFGALTSFSLASPLSGATYDESYVVSVIQEMRNLQSFTCEHIQGEFRPQQYRRSASPLAIHLASLTQLNTLDLSNAGCIDSSWSCVDWKAPIHTLTLNGCPNLSRNALHRLLHCFSTTLTRLRLGAPDERAANYGHLEAVSLPPPAEPPRFHLPKLRLLVLPKPKQMKEFMESFLVYTNIEKIHVGTKPAVDYAGFAAMLSSEFAWLYGAYGPRW